MYLIVFTFDNNYSLRIFLNDQLINTSTIISVKLVCYNQARMMEEKEILGVGWQIYTAEKNL